jgi:hypothetical protein
MLDKLNHPVIEASMLGTAAGAFGGFLPALTAVLPIVWYTIQIAESAAAKRLYTWLRTWFTKAR